MREVEYDLLTKQVISLTEGQPHWLCALSNASALLNEALPDINWVGFYLCGSKLDPTLPADELMLGPFQGKVACTSIPLGKGVCGTAAAQDKTLRVDDVHAFPGHIACDSASNSELVVPLHANGKVVGVLDIDSPHHARFTQEDQLALEQIARTIESVL